MTKTYISVVRLGGVALLPSLVVCGKTCLRFFGDDAYFSTKAEYSPSNSSFRSIIPFAVGIFGNRSSNLLIIFNLRSFTTTQPTHHDAQSITQNQDYEKNRGQQSEIQRSSNKSRCRAKKDPFSEHCKLVHIRRAQNVPKRSQPSGEWRQQGLQNLQGFRPLPVGGAI
jgi:hypothetical protein